MMTAVLRVLYVDDEQDLLDISKIFLEESGDFTVTTAISADEGIRLLEQEKFDAIISDYQMPVMNGIQFLVEVRSRFGPIPFILFTGRGREEVVIQAINSGADFYLQKGGEPGAQFAELSHKIKAAASSKRADDLLRKSEQKYRHLIEHSNEAIVVAQDGMLKLVNHKTIEFTGYSEQELLSMQFSVFIHPDDRAMVVERYQKRMKGEEGPSRYAFRLSSKDGSTRWVELSVVVIDWDGRPATLNFLTDITERNQAEEALRKSEEKFRKAFFTSPDSICITRLSDGMFISINKGFTEITGYTEEDVAGKTSLEINVWKDPEDRLKIVEELKAKGEVRNYEARFLTKSGEICGLMSTSIIELDGVPHILNITHDITERKLAEEALLKNTEELHASYEELTASEEELRQNVNDLSRIEQALRESEERFRLTLDATNDGIWDWDIPTGTAFFSPRWYTMLGYAPDEMPGSYATWRSLIHPDDIGPAEQIIQNHAERRDGGYRVEFRMRTKDGSWKWILTRGQVVEWDADNKPVRMVGTHTDITERKRAEQELISAHENLKEAHRLAHIGTWDWVIETDTVTWSEELCNISGWDPSLPAPTYAELPRIYTPASWDLLNAAVTNALNTGESYNLELELIRPDGSIRWTNAFGGVQRDETGKVIGLHGTLQDITERKRAEEADRASLERLILSEANLTIHKTELEAQAEELKEAKFAVEESRDKFLDLYDFAPLGYVTLSDKALITDVNLTGAKLLGVERSTLLKAPFSKHITKKDADPWHLYFLNVLKQEEKQTCTLMVLREGGSVFPAHLEGIRITRSDGTNIVRIAFTDISDIMHAEETLRNSEEKFRAIFNNAGDAIAIHNMHGRFLEVNDVFCRRLGYSREELLEMSPVDIDDPEYGEQVQDRIYELQQAGHIIFDTVHRGKGGIRIPTEVSSRMITYNREPAVISMGRDITERKRAEAALAESFATFRTVMDSLDALVYVADMKTHEILFVNEYGRKIWGDLTGKICWQSLQVNQKGPCPFCTNEKLLDSDGNPTGILIWEFQNTINGHWYECHDNAIRWTDGRIVRIEIATDITDRKRSEQELHKAHDEYVNLLEHIHDVYYRSDAEGRLILASTSWAKNLGYDHLSECLGKNIADTFYFDPVERRSFLDDLYQHGSVSDYEVTLKKKDGTPLSVATSSYLYFDETGEVLGVEGTWRDITERKQIEDALTESEEKYRAFFSTSRDFVFITSPEGTFIDFSDAALETLGYDSSEELSSIRIKDLYVNPAERERHLRAIAGQGFTKDYPLDIKKKDGSVIHTLISSVIRKDSKGNVIGFQGTVRDVTVQKRMEMALVESEERYNSLFTNNYSISLLIDPESGMIVDANAAACKYYGYSPEQIREMGIYEINRIDKERVIRNLKEAKKEKERHFFSTHFLSDGKQRNVEIYSGPIRVNGKTLFYSIIHDVTDRVKAEEELKSSRRFIEHTLTTTPALIYIYDIVEGRNVYTNRGIFETLGYTPEEISVMGQDLFLKILHPEDAGWVVQHHARFSNLPDSTILEIEYRMKHADGSWRWLHSRDIIFERTPDGAVKQILGSSIDITDRKMVEEALRESERRMMDIISFLPDATLVIDKNGTVLAWNRAMEEMTGVPAEQMIGKANYEYALPFYHERRPITVDLVLHDDPAVVAKYPFMLKEGRSRRSEIFIPHLNKGRGAYLWFMASPLYNADGNLMGAIESIRDITDRKQAEEALRQANKKLNILSSITRHDLKNQLLSLNGYLGISKKYLGDAVKLSEFIQKEEKITQNMERQILFTKGYECIGVNAPVWQDCRKLIDIAAKQAPLGQIIMKNDLPAGIEVFADPLIVKVFYNLMDNAVRYGGKITTIRFAVEDHDGNHVVVCEDDGVGVPVEEKEKIFERGFGKNTGLGLALAWEILDITGITIRETGEPGKGARFEMMVPKGAYRFTEVR